MQPLDLVEVVCGFLNEYDWWQSRVKNFGFAHGIFLVKNAVPCTDL